MIIPKQNKRDWGAFVSKYITGHKLVSAYDINYLFPLFLYEEKTKAKKINFTSSFKDFLKENYNHKSPEQILSYIYAILYSPTYRNKYTEFLKSDFPRISFTENKEIFDELSNLGTQLIALHLAEKITDEWQRWSPNKFEIFTTKDERNNTIAQYTGSGSHKIEEVRFALLKDTETPSPVLRQLVAEEKIWGRVYINQNKYFNYIPQSVWQMQIGGYRVLEKWLKDRLKTNRELSAQEINFYPQIVKTLCITQQLMQQINSFTASWI